MTVREEVRFGVAELLPDLDRADAWLLMVDGTAQSYVDLDDPTHLEFEYVRRLGHVVDGMAPAGESLRVLHLGGGAFTLPRYVAVTRPRSRQVVVEADGPLVELVRRELPVPGRWPPRVRVGDARAELGGVAPGSMDLVVLDVFVGARTPAHLGTVEFLRAVAATLRPGGLYAANVADGTSLRYARGQVAAALQVFARCAVIGSAAVLRGRRFGNLVLVAGDGELPVDHLARASAADPFPAQVRHGAAVRRFTGGVAAPTDTTAEPSPQPPAEFLS